MLVVLMRKPLRLVLPAAACLALALAVGSCGSAAPEAVLLIVVDTLRPDHLGLYGYGRQTSPHLDRFSREALIFENAWSTSSWTLPAMASLLSGRYPAGHGAGQLKAGTEKPIPGALHGSIQTLPGVLAASGWETLALINNPFLHDRFGLGRGFGEYDYAPANNRELRRADRSVDELLERLQGLEPPFFALLHLFDPHMDYDPPPAFRGRFSGASEGPYPVTDFEGIRARAAALSPEERRFIEAAYDEEVAFVDEQLGRLFGALEKLPFGDGLLIVVTSDHGEEFFEHGSFEHGHSLHGEVVRIPLLMRGPGVNPGRSQASVTLADLPSTVLDAFGLEPLPGAEGSSLWGVAARGETLSGRALPAEGILWGPPAGALLEWPFRLLLDESLDRVSLFDLRRDFEELEDLSHESPQRVAEMAARWNLHRQQPSPPWILPQLDPETLERLRSLGYIR